MSTRLEIQVATLCVLVKYEDWMKNLLKLFGRKKIIESNPIDFPCAPENVLEKDIARQSFVVFAVIYFVIGLFIISLDIGSHRLAAWFSGFMEGIIPSISGTAKYSPQPENARLILSFAWFLIPVYALILCLYDRGKSFRLEFIKKRKMGALLAVIGGLMLVVFMASHTPSPSTRGNAGFYYLMISSSAISLLLIQTGFVLAFVLTLYGVVWLPIETFRRSFKGSNA